MMIARRRLPRFVRESDMLTLAVYQQDVNIFSRIRVCQVRELECSSPILVPTDDSFRFRPLTPQLGGCPKRWEKDLIA